MPRNDDKLKLKKMEKFTTIKTTAVPLNMEDVDTDQIIPARFLKATTREGFGDNLFRDWRFNNDNTPKTDFVLNNPIFFVIWFPKLLITFFFLIHPYRWRTFYSTTW